MSWFQTEALPWLWMMDFVFFGLDCQYLQEKGGQFLNFIQMRQRTLFHNLVYGVCPLIGDGGVDFAHCPVVALCW